MPTSRDLLLTVTLFALALATGCTSFPPRAHEHMKIRWAATYEAAAAEAARAQKPLLVVLAAGTLDGGSCYGADAMRGDALSDARVIELVNREMVAVWINIRTTPVPNPTLDAALITAKLDADRRVSDWWSSHFFNRSIVLSPDGKTILNPQIDRVNPGVRSIALDGKLGYAEVNAGDYLVMMWKALARFRGQDGILLQQQATL